MPIADIVVPAQILEAIMMICFGASWPMAIYKTVRTRSVGGKSLTFLILILIGYLSGIAAKIVLAAFANSWPNWVTILYALNAAMVAVEIMLYRKYCSRPASASIGESLSTRA